MNEGLGNKRIFSENLKRMLDVRGMTLKELAEGVGLPYSTVTKWTQQKTYPSLANIEMLADYFGCWKSDLTEERGNSRTELEEKLFRGRQALRDVYREAQYLSDDDLRLAVQIIRDIRYNAEERNKEKAHGKRVLSERKEV